MRNNYSQYFFFTVPTILILWMFIITIYWVSAFGWYLDEVCVLTGVMEVGRSHWSVCLCVRWSSALLLREAVLTVIRTVIWSHPLRPVETCPAEQTPKPAGKALLMEVRDAQRGFRLFIYLFFINKKNWCEIVIT